MWEHLVSNRVTCQCTKNNPPSISLQWQEFWLALVLPADWGPAGDGSPLLMGAGDREREPVLAVFTGTLFTFLPHLTLTEIPPSRTRSSP